MYSTCLFCKKPLGTNDVLETFPVGRRIAFDASKGRLWVVCRHCERWNLSPLEERWEATEDAERLFRGTRMRVSTENIGLARLSEGLELVRIGQPMRPEFAAWRYGDQFGRRRKRALLIGAGAAVALGTVITAGLVTGAIASSVLAQTGSFINAWTNGRVLVRVRDSEGHQIALRRPQLQKVRLREEGGELLLRIRHRRQVRDYRGAEAERLLGQMMPRLNSSGARAAIVQDAAKQIESHGGAEEYVSGLIRSTAAPSRLLEEPGLSTTLGSLKAHHRLALEMALHEEQERRALEGELLELEQAWRAAEEIAAIADDLTLPTHIGAKLRGMRAS